MAYDVKNHHTFSSSPFPRRNRPFTETLKNGKDIILPRGTTIPEYIAAVYGKHVKVSPFTGKFNFLARDSKERSYDPGSTDPFVFSNWSSVNNFKIEAIRLLQLLTDQWKELGFPTTIDKDRGLELPDSEHVMEHLTSDAELRNKFVKYYEQISYIVSNVDILKKAAIIRSISPGWWVVSYDGKKSNDFASLKPAMDCYLKSVAKLMKTDAFKDYYAETLQSMGDPLDTAVGWPYYSAEIKEGVPISKLKVLTLFKDAFRKGGGNWSKIVEYMQERVKTTDNPSLADHPLAIASIRRMQYGYKWRHEWQTTSSGLSTFQDTRGDNTVRVAYAAAYIHNLFLSPFQAVVKTVRKMGQGQFHDGQYKKDSMLAFKKYKPFVIEADYSNYDRTMPVDIVEYMYERIAELLPNSSFWKDVTKSLHSGISLIWPDHVGSDDFGWIFKPDTVALLSGLKITSEEGTMINSIVVGQSYLDAGILTEDQLVDLYSTRIGDKAIGPYPKGFVPFMVQSDDTLLADTDLDRLIKLMQAFVINGQRAGIKATVEIGDRFLMRHCFNGNDSPLASRIWQNTLQNEEPYTDPLKFLVGIATRTDGLLGVRSVDPFGLGKVRGVTKVELNFTKEVLNSLLIFLKTSKIKVEPAVDFIETMLSCCERMNMRNNFFFISDRDHKVLTDKRMHFLHLLATREVADLGDINKLDANGLLTLIYQLHKNANIPSQAYQLKIMSEMDPRIAQAITAIQSKENGFYKFALNQIGLELIRFN